jgi:hypothetical protein
VYYIFCGVLTGRKCTRRRKEKKRKKKRGPAFSLDLSPFKKEKNSPLRSREVYWAQLFSTVHCSLRTKKRKKKIFFSFSLLKLFGALILPLS